MMPSHFLPFNQEYLKIFFVKSHVLHSLRTWTYVLVIVAVAFAGSVSCTNRQMLETEAILTLGPILEYEFSPDEQLVAVLLPTNAIEPGSDDYLSVVRSSLINGVSMLIFDVKTQEALARSDADSYTIENLRWSRLDNTIFYLDRGRDSASLISWQPDTNEKEEIPFQYGGFDIAPDNLTIVAWDKPARVQQSNMLAFYTWPQLEYIDKIILSAIRDIEDVQWSSNGSWLLVNTSSGVYRFDLDSQTLTQIEPLFMVAPDLNASDTLIAYGDPYGGIYSLQDTCIVKKLDTSTRQLEWSLEPRVLHLVLLQLSEKQNVLAQLDLTDSMLSCLSE